MNENPENEGLPTTKKSLREWLSGEVKAPAWLLIVLYSFAVSAMKAITLFQVSQEWPVGSAKEYAIIALAFLSVPFVVGYVRWVKRRAKIGNEAVSPVIGVILMVAITVALAAAVFVAVQHFGQSGPQTPVVSFGAAGAGGYTVIKAPNGLDWADFNVQGCSTLPTGSFEAGDTMTGCTGSVVVAYKPTNAVVWTNGA